MRQCVILAGGIGSRMRPLSEQIPKALLPVHGEPFAHYQLAWLASQGVREVVYSVGHRAEAIRRYVADGGRWGLSVTYVDEGAALRGTAGALRLAMDQGALEEAFFVLYGDSYLPIAFQPVADAFSRSGHPALMTVLCNQGRWDQSNALYRDGQVILYDKAPKTSAQTMAYIDYGLLVLSRALIADRVPPSVDADLSRLLHELSVEGQLCGFEVGERFYEVGSPEGLADFERYVAIAASVGSVPWGWGAR